MAKNKSVTYLLFAVFLTLDCDGAALIERTGNASDHVSALTLDIYKQSIFEKPNRNVIFSPSSIAISRGMMSCGPENQIAHQLVKNMRSLNDNNKYSLDVANKLFLSNKFEAIRRVIGCNISDVARSDFVKNSERERLIINGWVAKTTHHKITELIPKGQIDKDTISVLADAIYFKDFWESEFKIQDTRIQQFTVSQSHRVAVNMMHQQGTFNFEHKDDLEAPVLELKYSGGDISMFLVLPDQSDGIHYLEQKLSKDFLQKMTTKPAKEQVEISLPKFRFKDTLPSRVSDSLLQKSDNLSVIGDSKLFHKAFIEVDEKGTEAAAAGGHVIFKRSARRFEFNADHPFLFFTKYNKSDVLLFVGKVYDPTQVT